MYTSGGIADEAKHAIKADMAVKAVHADKADTADTATFAQRASFADTAADIEEDAAILERFLRRDKEDIAQETIRFVKGILLGPDNEEGACGISGKGEAILKEILSSVFSSGPLGAGFKLGQYGDTGDTYLEVDRMLVRKAAEFVQLVIRELKHVGGEVVLSGASMKCVKATPYGKGDVEVTADNGEVASYYRCWFRQEVDGEAVTNEFAAGDMVRCQTFNIKEGQTGGARNRYYWRRCVYAGTDFVDLSATDCDTGSDVPQAGDEMVLLGSKTDKARQSAIVLSAYGEDSPSLKMYYGISDYTLEDKAVVTLSRKEVSLIVDSLTYKTAGGYGDMATLDADVSGLKTSVSQLSEDVGTVRSEITQTAREVSVKVSEVTAGGMNMLTGTALRKWDTYTDQSTRYKVRVMDGGVGGTRLARCEVSGATASSYCGLKWDDVTVEPGQTYTYGVWLRLVSALDNGGYIRLETAGGVIVKDVAMSGLKTGEWVLMSGQVTMPQDCEEASVAICVRRNGTLDICRPSLTRTDAYMGWGLAAADTTEAESLKDGLLTTGIDVERGEITLTANQLTVRNNYGEQTAKVNEDGQLEVSDGLFTGFVRKRRTVVTPDNIARYVRGAVQGGYMRVDFAKAGSYIAMSGAMKAKFGSDYPTCILPFCDTKSSAAQLGVAMEEALEYVGQKIVITNSSDTTVAVQGGGTMRGGASPTYPYWVESGWMAVMTCEVEMDDVTKTARVVWNGVNAKM